jgi:hypothetical protein
MAKIEDKIEERTTANMDVVLEEVCRRLPHGGDHESRKYIAKKLMQSAKKGNVTLEGLRPVASRAFSDLSKRGSAKAETPHSGTSSAARSPHH